jgi:hypothetical protein
MPKLVFHSYHSDRTLEDGITTFYIKEQIMECLGSLGDTSQFVLTTKNGKDKTKKRKKSSFGKCYEGEELELFRLQNGIRSCEIPYNGDPSRDYAPIGMDPFFKTDNIVVSVAS